MGTTLLLRFLLIWVSLQPDTVPGKLINRPLPVSTGNSQAFIVECI